MKARKEKLAHVIVAGLPEAPTAGEDVFWDDAVRGLGLRLRAGSPATWIYCRRVNGRYVQRTLGRAQAMSLDQARAAIETMDEVASSRRVMTLRKRGDFDTL